MFFTMSGSMSSEVYKLNTKARRNLKRSNLKGMYEEKELSSLLLKNYEYDTKESLATLRWSARFLSLTAAAKKVKKLRKWSPEEDAFIRSTYMYLTDSTIALALNIPANVIYARRLTLSLTKSSPHKLSVVVWCERDAFDKDIEKHHLLKARPDVIL